MNVFERHVGDAEKKLSQEKRSNFWIKIFTLGFTNNELNIQQAEQDLKSCRNDLAKSQELLAEARAIDQSEETISIQGIRISKHSFADLKATGTETYPAEWQQLRQTILQRDNFTCQEKDGYCSGPLQIHHILELSKGGSNDPDNLITLCKYHHSMKHPHMQREY